MFELFKKMNINKVMKGHIKKVYVDNCNIQPDNFVVVAFEKQIFIFSYSPESKAVEESAKINNLYDTAVAHIVCQNIKIMTP